MVFPITGVSLAFPNGNSAQVNVTPPAIEIPMKKGALVEVDLKFEYATAYVEILSANPKKPVFLLGFKEGELAE